MKIASAIFILSSLSLAGQQSEKSPPPGTSNEIADHKKAFRNGLKEEALTASNRLALALKHFLIAERYLRSTKQPTTDPQLNVMPPGGGRAGVDPASIQNPEDRRIYEEAIAANLLLIEAHKAWIEASRLRQETISLIKEELKHDSHILLEDTIQVLWKQVPETVRQEIEAKRLNK